MGSDEASSLLLPPKPKAFDRLHEMRTVEFARAEARGVVEKLLLVAARGYLRQPLTRL